MNNKSISDTIISLKNADLELREKLISCGRLGEGYNEEMATIHTKNAEKLNQIISTIGYPTVKKVGKEAAYAAWLVIQHSIGHPDFMKKCAKLLDEAVTKNEADPRNLAYLNDRIAVFENRHQMYGTQFDWDENGNLSPNPIDDLNKTNERRKAIGLNTLQEQTEIIRKQAEDENQQPPKDLDYRKKEMEKWKKSVGWIK